jgi:hypothetical protein
MSKKTIQELFNLIPAGKINFSIINNAIMQVDKGSKKKAAFIKVGVADEVAQNFLTFDKPQNVAMLVMVDNEEFERARKELLKDEPPLTIKEWRG